MKWIGQQIYDQVSRFRHDFYLEGIAASTETDMLVVDNFGKVSKRAIDAITVDVSDFMTNGVDNRVLTATGADAMNAEANLTFSGTQLSATLAGGIGFNIDHTSPSNSSYGLKLNQSAPGLGIAVDHDETRTAGIGGRGFMVDYDKTAVLADGETGTYNGTNVNLYDQVTNHSGSTFTQTGNLTSIVSTGSAGAMTNIGYDASVYNLAGGGTNIGFRSNSLSAGGIDFYSQGAIALYATNSTDDYFKIVTAVNGTTTLTTVDAAAAAAHFNIVADGNITLDAAGNIALETAGGSFNCDAAAVEFTGTDADRPSVSFTNNANDATGPNLFFGNKRDGNGLEDGDVLGTIHFAGEDAAGATETYGNIIGSVIEADHGDEAGQIAIYVANDGAERNGITMTADKGTATEVDVTIANGAASTTTIAGDLQVVGGNIIGTTDGDIQIDSDNHIILNVDNDDDSSNQFIKFADNGTDTFTFNVAKSGTEINGRNPHILLNSTSDDNLGNDFLFKKERIDSTTQIGEVGDNIGTIHWQSYNNGTPAIKSFATMLGEIADPVTGTEAGNLILAVASYNGTLTNGLQLWGDTNANGEVDVTIASGAASTTTIAGTLTMGSTATLNNTGEIQVASQPSITTLAGVTSLGAAGQTDEITITSDTVTFTSANSDDPLIKILNTTDNNQGARLFLWKARTDSTIQGGEADDEIGALYFYGYDSAAQLQGYGKIETFIDVATHGQESGIMQLGVASHDGGFNNGLYMRGGSVDTEVDVTVGNGTASTTTVAGNLTVTGTTIDSPGRLRLNPAAGDDILLDGTISIDAGVITEVSSLTSTVIELGHANDTTIARASAGVVTIEGNQIVTAGATSVASGSQAPIGMQVARRTITQAEMNDLHNTPIAIIPALGANLVAIPVNGTIFVDRAANNTNSAQLVIGYGSSTFANSIYLFKRFHYNVSTDFHYGLDMYVGNWGTSMTAGVNTAINASADTAYTNNAFTSVDVYINYYVIDRS